MPRGKFIVLEGADGSGTTTQAISLAMLIALHTGDWEHILRTHEPSQGLIGMLIRRILRNYEEPWPWREMSYLFMADRLHHVREEIEPALQEGRHVICDRYYASTLVYQSASAPTKDHRRSRLEVLYKEMLGFALSQGETERSDILEPDLWLYLKVPSVGILAERRQGRGEAQEMYEGDDTQDRVLEMYDHWFKETADGNVRVIDATHREKVVTAACWKEVCKVLRIDEERQRKVLNWYLDGKLPLAGR